MELVKITKNTEQRALQHYAALGEKEHYSQFLSIINIANN